MGIVLVYNSKGFSKTAFVETQFNIQFNICIVIFSASPLIELGKLVLLTISLTMSINVVLFLSTTPFCYGVLGIVYCAIIPSTSRNRANKLGLRPQFSVSNKILTTSIESRYLNFHVSLFFYFHFKYFKDIQSICFFFNQIDIVISWKIIYKNNEVFISRKTWNMKFTTYIRMNYF